jgi:hypothetical protein
VEGFFRVLREKAGYGGNETYDAFWSPETGESSLSEF